jgi:hypothetical protein
VCGLRWDTRYDNSLEDKLQSTLTHAIAAGVRGHEERLELLVQPVAAEASMGGDTPPTATAPVSPAVTHAPAVAHARPAHLPAVAVAVASSARVQPALARNLMLATVGEALAMSAPALCDLWERIYGRPTNSGNVEYLIRAVVFPGVTPRRGRGSAHATPHQLALAAAASATLLLQAAEEVEEVSDTVGTSGDDEEEEDSEEEDSVESDMGDGAGDGLGFMSDDDSVVPETPLQDMGLLTPSLRATVCIDASEDETTMDLMDPTGAFGDDGDDDDEEEEEEAEEFAEEDVVTESASSLEHHVEPDWHHAAWAAEAREIARQADSFQSYCDGEDY